MRLAASAKVESHALDGGHLSGASRDLIGDRRAKLSKDAVAALFRNGGQDFAGQQGDGHHQRGPVSSQDAGAVARRGFLEGGEKGLGHGLGVVKGPIFGVAHGATVARSCRISSAGL